MHIFHKWPKWETRKVEGEYVILRGSQAGKSHSMTWYEQTRTCEDCGKLQLREVSSE